MKARWSLATVAAAAAMLALPLGLFAALSYWKLGFMSFSWYVPYEQFSQDFASGDLGRIYRAPLAAINVTSGFVIANMFTYTLGHTVATLVLVALVMLHVAAALRRARACAARMPAAPAGGAAAGVFAATVASSSAALTGCCGAGMAGGIVALAGLGSATGAWMADAATYGQALLVAGLGTWFFVAQRRSGTAQQEPQIVQ